MEEFSEVKTIDEWEAEITKNYEEEGIALDNSLSFQRTFEIPDDVLASLDGYTLFDSQILDRLIALYRVECKRFKNFLPSMYGAYVLRFGGLTVDQLAGIVGLAIDRLSTDTNDQRNTIDNLERMFSDDGSKENPGDGSEGARTT